MNATTPIQISATQRFSGSFTALITPFRGGAIDEPALRRMVDRQVDAGITGLVPCGTTGEAATMTEVEQDRVVSLVLEQTGGRLPVLVGTGGNGTAATIARTRRAQELGAHGALVVTPYYNKPSQEGLIAHYAAIADAVDLPLVLYNVPGRTGVNMLPETVVHLASWPNIVGVKEASGSLDQASHIVRHAPPEFMLLSGDDSLTVPMMAIGGRGVISVVSNIAPKAIARLTSTALVGDFVAARELHLALFDLCRAMFAETNPVPIKATAALLGLCGEDVRPPLCSLSPASRVRIEEAVSNCAFLPEVPAAA